RPCAAAKSLLTRTPVRGTAPFIFGHDAMSIDLRGVGLAQSSGAGAKKLEIDKLERLPLLIAGHSHRFSGSTHWILLKTIYALRVLTRVLPVARVSSIARTAARM